MSELPDFYSPTTLRAHIADTLAFYHPHAIDSNGGFFQYFKDDGTIYDRRHRHLVSSTRFIFNYAMAAREYAKPAYLEAARHGLRFLREVHRNPMSGGYAWTLSDGKPEDRTNHCYGIAFVLLAYAAAVKAGIDEARDWLQETWGLLEKRFFEPHAGLYRDEADADWNFSPYRGQNANMHLCEALLVTFEASGERRYLERAYLLADNMARRQAAKAGGLIWEHYDSNWEIDWDYNRDNPRHLFRPWGFQAGHQTEWAKLLMILERHFPDEAWLTTRARELFDAAVKKAWDSDHGGIYYGFAPDDSICDSDKYYWVQAESLVATTLLATRTGDSAYWNWYERLWTYAWKHFVDHKYGAWYRILDRRNNKYSDEKSPAGKTDYHTMGACYELMSILKARD